MNLKDRSSERANKAADNFLKMLKSGFLRKRSDPSFTVDRPFDEESVFDAMEKKLHHDILQG